ncbi:MAG TPA: iron-sulfur cluster assembly accessory protein [Actinomycetota bacterium]
MQLTQTAAEKVKELLAQEGHPEAALRVAARPGGCCGYRYSMALTDQIDEADQTVEHHGIRVVVDSESVPLLDEATIDFVDSLERSGFAIENPKAGGGCTCGH